MTNRYYTAPEAPVDYTRARASVIRQQFAAIEAGFGLIGETVDEQTLSPLTVDFVTVNAQLTYPGTGDLSTVETRAGTTGFTYDTNLLVVLDGRVLTPDVDYTAAGGVAPIELTVNPGADKRLSLTTYATGQLPAGSGGGGFVYVNDYTLAGDADNTAGFWLAAQAAVAAGLILSFKVGEGKAVAGGPGGLYPRWLTGDYVIGVDGQNSPAGTFSGPSFAGNLLSNLKIYVPPGVNIRQKPDTSYVFYHNPVGIGTVVGAPHITELDDAQALTNVWFEIDGVIDGNCDSSAQGFVPNVTLIFISGASGVTIQGNGQLINFRSEAIQLAPGDVGPHNPGTVGTAKQIHHTGNITVRDITIDGIDKNNRNGIAVINCDGLLVDNVKFKNCCRPGNGGATADDPFDINTGPEAPGFIDYEPNYFSFPWVTLRNCVVRNCIFDTSGTCGVVFNLPHNKYLDGATTRTNNTVMENFFVQNCSFTNMDRAFAFGTGGTPGIDGDLNGAGYNIVTENNTARNCDRAWDMTAARGVTIRNNLFADMATAAYTGYHASYGLRDIKIVGNRFERCGNALGAWTCIGYGGEHWEFDSNEFLDCAVCAFSFSGAGTWDDGKIRWNKILPATPGYTAKVMGSAIYNGDFNGVAVFDNKSIVEEGNDWGGLSHFQFVVVGSKSAAVPAGTWDTKSYVVYPEAPRGEPMVRYCVKSTTGAANPDVWVSELKPGGLADAAVTPGWTEGGKTAGMTVGPDGRFTSTATGVQTYYSATAVASPELIYRAPMSGDSGVIIGFTDAAAPTAQTDFDYGSWPSLGVLHGVIGMGLYDPATAATEWMTKIRITYNSASGVITVYRTDPFTLVESTVWTGGGFPTTSMRMFIFLGNKGETIQVEKFA